MPLFYVETTFGCGLMPARDIRQAQRKARTENGTRHFRGVRKATDKDVAWVRGMGGHVPGRFDK